MENEYIIIGDIHGDISILFNIINNVFHIDITKINNDNSNDLLKNIVNSNKIIVLLGDIFDNRHEIYDIKYYDYNKYNNTNYNNNTFNNYKDEEFINCYNIIKLLKEKLKDKLILILGNHDIRYYKNYDITKINIITNNNIVNEIKEYLTFINNNFVLLYNIYNKIICYHYFEFNKKHQININLNDINKLKDKVLKLSDKIQEKNKNVNYNLFIKGHTKEIDYIIDKKIIYLDNRMSRFKYNLSKCLINNCYNLYLHIFKLNDNIFINKINNNKIIYQLNIEKNDNYKINFF